MDKYQAIKSGFKLKEIEGIPMVLAPKSPGISDELYRKGGREFAFMWILRKECEAELGIDVGANIGYTTLPIAQRCKIVCAYEPDKRSRKLLKHNIELNELKNVNVYKFAVSDKNRAVYFHKSKKPNQSKIVKNPHHPNADVRVEAVTLDTHLFVNQKSLFMKMDVEGHETKVIEGAKALLGKVDDGRVLMELHKDVNYTEMFATLKKLKYKLKYVVNAKGMRPYFDEECGKAAYGFKNYERAVWKAFPKAEEWSMKLIKGKKMIRSMLWVRHIQKKVEDDSSNM